MVVLDGFRIRATRGPSCAPRRRSAPAGILFLKGTVSPHNPKTLRASAGSLFRVPFVHGMDAAAARAALQQKAVELFAAMPAAPGQAARALAETRFDRALRLIIGNEAHGVTANCGRPRRDVSIPTVGVESLNAAVAAGILLYEARRQRMLRP